VQWLTELVNSVDHSSCVVYALEQTIGIRGASEYIYSNSYWVPIEHSDTANVWLYCKNSLVSRIRVTALVVARTSHEVPLARSTASKVKGQI
jgi:hypothetical protein